MEYLILSKQESYENLRKSEKNVKENIRITKLYKRNIRKQEQLKRIKIVFICTHIAQIKVGIICILSLKFSLSTSSKNDDSWLTKNIIRIHHKIKRTMKVVNKERRRKKEKVKKNTKEIRVTTERESSGNESTFPKSLREKVTKQAKTGNIR